MVAVLSVCNKGNRSINEEIQLANFEEFPPVLTSDTIKDILLTVFAVGLPVIGGYAKRNKIREMFGKLSKARRSVPSS